ncbi:MAG TPA: hypothetical protein VI306_00600 [Pyrinomonadaceae bacterium]
MGEWIILTVTAGLFLGGVFVRKLDSLVTIHIEWGLVRLEFKQPPRTAKKPVEAKPPRQLKQVKRLPR